MATTVTPSTPLSSAGSGTPIVRDLSLPDRLVLGLLGLVALAVAIIELAWTGLSWVLRRGVVTAQTYYLNAEQYNALIALVWLQHEIEQQSWFDFGSLDDDPCPFDPHEALDPHERRALERCAAAQVPCALIKRFAPAYAGSMIVPMIVPRPG